MMTRHRQHGMTFIGYLLLFGLLGMVVMVGLRLLPAYMEYFKVSSTLESVAEESNVETTTAQLRQAIAARFQVNGVNTIRAQDIAVARNSGVLTLTAAYEYRTPMMANVDAVVVFEKVVEGSGN